MARTSSLKGSPVARARLGSFLLPLALVGTIFAGHLLLGANRDALGLIFAMAQALVFAIAAVAAKQRSGALLSSRALRPIGILALLVLAQTALVAASRAIAPWAALVEWVKLAALICTGGAALLITQKLRSPKPLLTAMMVLGAAYIGLCLVLYALAPGSVLGLEKYTAQDRFTATFVSANSAAMLCTMLLLVAAADLIPRARALVAAPVGVQLQLILAGGWLALLVSVLAMAGLALTASRAGLILCAAALMAFVLWDGVSLGRNWISRARAVAPVAFILGAGMVVGLATIGARESQAGESAQFRLQIWQAHWPLIIQQPWLGYGLGAFATLNSQATTPDNFDLLSTIGAMHNVYLQWLEQGGVIGAALMFALVVSLLWPVARGAIKRADEFSVHQRLTIVLSAYVLAHGWFDYGLETPSIAAQWAMILGLGVATTLRSRDVLAGRAAPRAKAFTKAASAP